MKIMVRITSQNGVEVAKAGQIADKWLIGLINLMANKLIGQ